MKRSAGFGCSIWLGLAFTADAALAGGVVDPTFGRDGISVQHATEFPDAVERSGRLRVDTFGRSVFAVQSDRRILVERRLPDGSVDLGFGEAGRASVDIGGIEQTVVDLEVVKNGPQAGGVAILSAGSFGGRCTITRLDASGNLVATFGASGFRSVFDPATDVDARCIDLALDGEAPIVAAELRVTSLVFNVAMLAFDEQGMPLAGFGNAGRVVLDLPGSGAVFDRIDWVDVTGFGVVVAGRALLPSGRNLFLARLDRATGALDPSFSGDGVWFESIFASEIGALAGVATSDGILLLGLATRESVFYYWKVGAQGASDPGFGTDGRCFALLPEGVRFDGTRLQGEVVVAGPRALSVFSVSRASNVPDPTTTVVHGIDRSSCAPSGAFATPRVSIDEEPFASNGHRFAGAALQGSRLLVGGVVGTPILDASLHALDTATGAVVGVAIGERVVFVNGTIPSFDSPLAAGPSGSGTVIAGVTYLGSWTTLYALRLDDRGRRDPAFGGAGAGLVPVQQAYPLPYAAAMVRDADILLAGTKAYASANPRPSGFDEPYGPHLYRLLANGDVDTSFGNAGVVAPATGSDGVHVVALGSDGDAVLMLSREHLVAAPASILHRLLPTGAVDPGFANGGPLRFALGGSDPNDRFDAVVATSNAIYVAGSDATLSGRVVIRAFTRSGAPLAGFGAQGRRVVLIPGALRSARVAMSVWGEQLVVASLAFDGSRSQLVVVRLDANGQPDPDFGTVGIARADLGAIAFNEFRTTLHRDGDALVAATTSRSGPSPGQALLRMGVVRFDAAGRLDPGFGSGGIVEVDVDHGVTSSAAGLAVFPQHYVLSGNSNQRTVAVRLSKGPLDRLFGNGFE